MLKRFIFLNKNLELDLSWSNKQTKGPNTQDAISQKSPAFAFVTISVKDQERGSSFFLYLSVLHCKWVLWKRNEISTSCCKRFHYLTCCMFTTAAINNENIMNIIIPFIWPRQVYLYDVARPLPFPLNFVVTFWMNLSKMMSKILQCSWKET